MLAQKLQRELVKVDDIGITYIVGTGPEEIRVEPDPEKLSLFGVTLQQLVAKVRDANRAFVAGQVRDAGTDAHAGCRPDAARRAGYRPAAGRPRATGGRSMCATWRRWWSGPGRSRPACGTSPPEGESRLAAHARGEPGAGQAAGANAVVVSQDIVRTRLARVAGPADPARHARPGHPRLRQDGQRQGQRAAVPSRRSPRFPSWC